MPSPKTPENIVGEFIDRFQLNLEDASHEADCAWLRASMQSLLLHVMEKMPTLITADEIPTSPNAVIAQRTISEAYGRNKGIIECVAVIQSTIDSIKE